MDDAACGMKVAEYFQGYDESFGLFQQVLAAIRRLGPSETRVGKSQLGFYRRRGFAYVWIPQKALKRPAAPLVLSIPLHRRDASPAWKQVVEPRKGRFMHHLELWTAEALSAEIIACLEEAYGEAE